MGTSLPKIRFYLLLQGATKFYYYCPMRREQEEFRSSGPPAPLRVYI